MCGHSAKNSDNLDKMLSVMLPDGKIAQNFSLGKTKYGYSLSHGLGPNFMELTIDVIKEADALCVWFDESLNFVTNHQKWTSMSVILTLVKTK